MDPYERADVTSNTYYEWLIRRAYIMQAAQTYVGQFLQSFKEFPQRQKAATFNLDDVMEQMEFASNQVNIIILDACRNNPVARTMRSATRGLATMQSDSVRGTFIAYSTSPGQTAADG